jgi:hypothetical protein
MSRKWLFGLLALVVVLFVVSVAFGSRLAAGGGAALLLAAIVYATIRNRGGSPEEIARAERGARELREEIAEDEARSGAP